MSNAARIAPPTRTPMPRSYPRGWREVARLAGGRAVIARAGSLYYSEVAGSPPCEYCWYQRIAMYPLVVILGVAMLRRDRGGHRYVLPLAIPGRLISLSP